MKVVSLRARVVLSGVAVVSWVLVGFDAIVYLTLRAELRGNVGELLDERTELVRSLAAEAPAGALVDRLVMSGIPATVLPAGAAPGDGPPPPGLPGPHASRSVPLPDGGTVEVFASYSGAHTTLRRLLWVEAVGTLAGIVVAAAVLVRVSRDALAPLRAVVGVARRIAAGQGTERLRPSRTDTEIGELAVAFDEMLDALEAAVDDARVSTELTQRFLSDVAHQLRTPIAGIRASAEALAMDPKPAQQERLLANLASESERAGRLLAALLQMARIDQGEAPDRRPSDLVALCRQEVDRASELAPELRVFLDVEGNELEPVELDPASMREVMANLLDNARRHAVTRIGVSVSRRDGVVEIRVADDGTGMSDELAERAFERFVSLDACGGSGLGLPIARGIVRAHGGELSYERKQFVVRLPARQGAGRNT